MWLNEREFDVRKVEELGVRYFRAVGVTTKSLLETVVAMLFLTCTARGCRSVREYCKRQLKWRRSDMRSIFTNRERQCLQVDPTREPFGADLNIKLLTKVWTGLGEDVAIAVEDLRRLTLTAIHEPSRINSKEHLWRDLDQLFSKQRDLTHNVLRYCHRALEETLSSLFKERAVLKRGYGAMCKELLLAADTIRFAPLDRAVADMEMTYRLLAIVEGKIPDLSSSPSLHKMLNHISEKTNTLDQFGRRLDVYRERNLELTARIDWIKELYVNLIHMGSLYDIIEELNYIGGTNVSEQDLRDWHETLASLRQERTERLKVVGRSELSSHIAWGDAGMYDASRWLLARRATTVNVEKVYSLIRRHDTNEITTVDDLFNLQMPRVIVISGPMGCGKTCLRQYLFNKWRAGSPSARCLSEFQLFLPLTSGNVRSGSVLHHVRSNVFPRALAGLEDSGVLDALQQLRTLFFIDITTSGPAGGVAQAVEELITAAGRRSTVIITVRPEKTKEILQVFRNLKLTQPVVADILPLAGSQLKALCLDFLGVLHTPEHSTGTDKFGKHPVVPSVSTCGHINVGGGPVSRPHRGYASDKLGVIENTVNKFMEKLLSEKREEELLYPLPLAYMMMLWLEEPRRLNDVRTVSHLFEEVIAFCESELRAKMRVLCVAEKKEISRKSKETMNEVFNAASRIFRNGSASVPDARRDTREDLSVSDAYGDSLFPLLICSGQTDQTKPQHRFLHPSLIDVLHARDITVMLSHERAKHLCFKPDLPDVLPLSLVERLGGDKYLNVLKYLCGFSSRRHPLRAATATYLVRLVRCAGVQAEDYGTWEGLLREGAWSQELKRAVSDALARSHTWKAPRRGSYSDAGAVPRLVAHGVYLPRSVTITTEAPEEVIDMLLSRPDIDVVVPPPPGLRSMSEAREQDALLKALRKSSSVTELWGKLGPEGALALGSMKRLRTMHVHISSLDAFVALSESVKSCQALRTLHLYLDLPAATTTTPAQALPPLQCPASASVCLSLYGITDDSLEWAVVVARGLGRRCHEVNLARSRLSSLALQQIKDRLHPTPVHVSG